MNDSFSRLAQKIRQNKINKKEIENIKREIIDGKVLKIIKNDMATKIQKIIRGFLYRKKYYIFLDEVNTETIINYLYEKKLERINTNYKNIISYHCSNYIKKLREEKEKIKNRKIYCINLIKSILRGIIFRKNFNKEISLLKEIKNKIERYILGYKIKLILRSNNIQSLLIDIANIKYSLNNIDKTNEVNNQKIKELKTKLTKNINLFYFTFYQMKENSNWISQSKIKEPWIKKYLSIINKDGNDKNIFIKKKSIYSNQKKIRRLKENNNKNNDNKKDILKSTEYKSNSKNNTINYEKDNIINNEKEKEALNTENNYYSKDKKNKDNYNDNKLDKNDKNYDFNFYDSESDDLDDNVNRKVYIKGTEIYKNKNIKNEIKKNKTLKEDIDIKHELYTADENDKEKEKEKQKGKKIRSNIVKRYKSKKVDGEQKLSSNHSKSFEVKEEKNSEKKENQEISDFIEKEESKLNNEEEEKKDINQDNNNNENKDLENEKVKEEDNKPKTLNKYQQREERPIKPLTNINFLDNENPFGLRRESSDNIAESQNLNLISNNKNNKIEKRVISSTRAINRANINYNQKGKNKKQNISEIEKEETIKTQEKTDLSHEELPVSNKYIEYDNRPCGGGSKNAAFYDINKYDESLAQKKLDRNERPLGGAKKIDYNAMFGDEGNDFEGDPFGGAKQYETNNNKEKLKNYHKSNTIKKKPVYDARKAIEEAKIKEAKEGKKEKPSAFREFLREMKKISAEEKASHNETTNNDNIKAEKKIKNNNKIKNELNTESNIIETKIEKSKYDKLDAEDKIQKRNLKKQGGMGLNLNKENEDNIEFSNSDNNNINIEDKENTLKKKHRGSVANKGTETKEMALRRKLHELEKAPAPVLNIKGIKSRIECWGANNDNKRGKINSMAPKPKENPKSKDEKKTKNNKNVEQKIESNFINNKKIKEISNTDSNINSNKSSVSTNNIPKISKNMEEKLEKYVDKKLMQLYLQIEEINELFNFDNYFKNKEDKMKLYINLPYIKENFNFVKKYEKEDYEEKIEEIEKIYKELK